MAASLAPQRAGTVTTKMSKAVKDMWDVRTKLRATMNDATSHDVAVKAQIDEVFLVLAHLGQALLPLGVYNRDYYQPTLADVQASLSNCGNEFLPPAWAELDDDLQYVCTAGLTFCATYSPMHVYRGFGACVLGDWDWACPDSAYLEEKARRKAIRTIYGVKQKVDAQPMRSVFLAFDQAIQILQVKPMAFLEKRPAISGFADRYPRYGARPKKEVKDELDLLEDWVKQLEKRGHPGQTGGKLTSYGFPFASWTSPFNCHILTTEKDCETIMLYQMDPGRLLHALVCRGTATLNEGQIFLLPPRSPVESLMCWLEGLPGTTHRIIKWSDLNTEWFELKLSKSLRKKMGNYPLPTQFAVKDPKIGLRPAMSVSSSSPSLLESSSAGSPPPYRANMIPTPSAAELYAEPASTVAELPTPDPSELPATAVSPRTSPHSASLPNPHFPSPSSSPPPHNAVHAVSLPAPGTENSLLKTIHTLRRKPSPNPPVSTSSPGNSPPLPSSTAVQHPAVLTAGALTVPANNSGSNMPPNDRPSASVPEGPAPVELPTDFHSEAPKGLNISTSPQHEEPTTSASQKYEEPRDPATESNYLELLQKVANGEISPQALGAMLQGVNATPPAKENDEEGRQAISAGAESKKAASDGGLPYPTTPIERKSAGFEQSDNANVTMPYPVTPPESKTAAREPPTSKQTETAAFTKAADT